MKNSNIVRYIGIDFGTSTSVVSYMDYEKISDTVLRPMYSEPLPVKFDEAYTTVPTVVQIPGKQYNPVKKDYVELTEMSFGRDAVSKLSSHPDLVRQNFKMALMSEDEEKRNEARELLGLFFKMLYETYKEQRRFSGKNEPEEYTYVSYPAKWSEENNRLMVEVASKAGFPNVRGMDEPVAAMRYCLTTETEKIKELRKKGIFVENTTLNVMLIDMGAGTTDLVIYKFTPKNDEGSEAEVLATYPPAGNSETFGGSEIDDIISEYIRTYLEENLYKQPLPYNKLKDICKTWKEKVISPELQNRKTIDDLPSDLIYVISYLMKEDAREFPGLDRAILGELLKSYMPIFINMVNNVIEKSGLTGDDIDLVIVTGGHSQWYFVNEVLLGNWVPGLSDNTNSRSGIFLKKIINEPWRIVSTPYPQQVVSQGLAMAGKQLQYKKNTNSKDKIKEQIVNQEIATGKNFNEESSSSSLTVGSNPIFSSKAFVNQVKCIAISNNGDMLAAGSKGNTKINLWNLKSAECFCTVFQNNEPDKIQFSFNDSYIISSVLKLKPIYVFEIKKGKYDNYLNVASAVCSDPFDVSPVRNEFIHRDIDSIKKSSLPNKKVLYKWEKVVSWLSGRINTVAYSYDGSMILTALHNKNVIIYDNTSGKQLSRWNWRNADLINTVAISKNGRRLGAIDFNGSIHFWSLPGGSYEDIPGTPLRHGKILEKLFTPSLNHAIIINDTIGNNVDIYNLNTLSKIENIPQFSNVTAMTISRDERYIATGHRDGTINVWELQGGI